MIRRNAGLVASGLLAVSAAFAAPTIRPTVVRAYPHDPAAFTQGLLLREGMLYESTGLQGRSSLRRVDLETGTVEQRVDLAEEFFGEGLARVDNRLIQLTWKNGLALVYDVASFGELTRLSYTGEGWGLCYDGTRLVMSDGSSTLFFRDPDTFELQDQIEVSEDAAPVTRLNELECVGDEILANQWQTDRIVRIEKATGRVLTNVDASGLLTAEEAASADVLNGIAFIPESGRYLLTGKLWPKIFEVELDFGGGSGGAAGDSGSGGDAGTGGDSGSGGVSGTAGDSGSGGDAGTAGDAAGSAGSAGSGGSVGGVGGDSGEGGAAGDGADSGNGGSGNGGSNGGSAGDDGSAGEGEGGSGASASEPSGLLLSGGGCGCRSVKGDSSFSALGALLFAAYTSTRRSRRR